MPGGGASEGLFDDALELEMFDDVANDLPNLVQCRAQLWKRRTGASVDPVYHDFNKEEYIGPFEIVATADQGFAKMLSMDPDAGLEITRESEIYVTRKELERVEYGFPETGDVILFLMDRIDPYSFYIQNAHQEGRLPQGRAFIMWRFEIKYISRADPSDIIDGEPCVTKTGRRID